VDGLLKLGSRKQRNRAGTVPVRFAIAGRAVARRRQPVDVVRRAGSSGVTMQAQANFSPFSVPVAVVPAGTMHSGKMSCASVNTTRVPLLIFDRSSQRRGRARLQGQAFQKSDSPLP
jgi:hypothetical protein